jgi:hypothetical protein
MSTLEYSKPIKSEMELGLSIYKPKEKLGLSTYKQLNNYYFDEDYKDLKEYLKHHIAPINFDRLEKARFYYKYGKDFKIINKEIVYEPLDLIVANPDKKVTEKFSNSQRTNNDYQNMGFNLAFEQ